MFFLLAPGRNTERKCCRKQQKIQRPGIKLTPPLPAAATLRPYSNVCSLGLTTGSGDEEDG